MFNPEAYSPRKLDLTKLKSLGLSKNQMMKINYECDLLRVAIEQLVNLAPYMFVEGVTAANTAIQPSNDVLEDEDELYSSSPYFHSEYL